MVCVYLCKVVKRGLGPEMAVEVQETVIIRIINMEIDYSFPGIS